MMVSRHPITRQRREGQRGQAFVETALVMLVYFYMVMGVIECGRMVYSFHTISHAARDGARYASVHGNSSGAPATNVTVKNFLRPRMPGITSNDLAVNVSFTPNGNPGGNALVDLNYTYRPVLRVLFPITVALKAKSKMVVLY